MKKGLFFFVFILSAFYCFSQVSIDEALSLLGKPLPSGYTRLDRTTYKKNDGTILLKLDNNIVITCSIGKFFNNYSEAQKWTAQFYDIADSQHWTFYSEQHDPSVQGYDLYEKNGVVLGINQPSYTDKGDVSAFIILTIDQKLLPNSSHSNIPKPGNKEPYSIVGTDGRRYTFNIGNEPYYFTGSDGTRYSLNANSNGDYTAKKTDGTRECYNKQGTLIEIYDKDFKLLWKRNNY